MSHALHPRPAAPLAVAALALLLTATRGLAPAAAQPLQPFAQTSIVGFTDVNGNGQLDCGEPVQIVAAFTTNNAGTPALSGVLDVPAAGTVGLDFEPGSLVIDPELTVGCQAVVTSGDDSGDTAGQVAFTCPADPVDNNSWIVVVRYTALYVGATPAYTATAEAILDSGPSYNAAASGSAGGATCASSPAALSIAKTAAGPATPGSTLLYTLTTTDTSGLGQGGLQLVDTVPAGGTFDAAASSPGWTCTPGAAAGSVCRNPVGNVAPNGSVAAYFAVTLDATFAAGAAVTNTGCVRLGPSVVAACASVTTAVAGTPVLHLGKTLTAGNGAPGSSLAYTLSASNTGNEGLADVQLAETVPANTSLVAGASPGWSCTPDSNAGAACTLDVGALAAGATVDRTFTVVVADPLPALPPGAAISNTACLSVQGGGAAESRRLHGLWGKRENIHHRAGVAGAGAAAVASSCATVSTPVDGSPSLSLAKTLKAGSSAAPGGALAYDLAVADSGNEGASGVTLSETVPTNTSYAAAASSPGWSCTPGPGAGGACTLALGNVAAATTVHATFAVVVANPLAAGVQSVGNTACAQRAGGSPVCDTLATPTAGQAHLTLGKTYSGGPVAPGAVLLFHLAAANTGNQGAAGVVVSETVPAGASFDAADGTAGWSCSPGPAAGAACTLSLGTLAAGATAAVTFAVRATDPLPAGVTQIANAACVTATGGATACGQATTPAAAALTGELEATFAYDANHDRLAETGDQLLYTLTVLNPTSATAHQLVLATPPDPHLVLDVGSVTTTAGAITAGNTAGDTIPSVTLAALAPGASVTITFTATVGALPAGLKVISSQSVLTGADVPPTVSDDPETAAPLDPTVTPVGTSPAAAVGIPTLSTWGLVLLAVGLATVSSSRLRRRGPAFPRPINGTHVPAPAPGGGASGGATSDRDEESAANPKVRAGDPVAGTSPDEPERD